MMMILYRLLFLPLLLLALPYYGWRMLRRGGYRHDFHHRFGLIDRPPAKQAGVKRIWIQAVSVGELLAIGPLLHMLAQRKDIEVVLTTTTSTGYEIARKHYDRLALKIGIFPLDFYPFSRNAWRRLDPDMAILMESELWPEHLAQAKARNVPVVLINARLSDRSFKRYSIFKRTARRLMKRLSLVLASSKDDAERYRKLSNGTVIVEETGNLKFDVVIEPILSQRERELMKQNMGLETGFRETRSPMNPPMILLGSSTWPGEEAFLIEVLEAALQKGVNLRLLIVPRHAERRGEIIELLKKQTRSWHFRSESHDPGKHVRIYVADTTGELAMLSQIGDIAFVGKSLEPNNGGQTPIEAAALGIPMVYGPNMSNFRPVCRSLEKAGAAIRTQNATDAKRALLELLTSPRRRTQMKQASKEWHVTNQGATERTMEHINDILRG